MMIPPGFQRASTVELHDSKTIITVDPITAGWLEYGDEYKMVGTSPNEKRAYQITELYARIEGDRQLRILIERGQGERRWGNNLVYNGNFTVWWYD